MIGIVFATEMEAAPFLERLAAAAPLTRPSTKLAEGRLAETAIVVMVCGMGKADATEGLKNLIEQYRPRGLLNLGIAGALTSAVPVGGVRRVLEAVDWPGGEAVLLNESLPEFDDIPTAKLVTADEPVFDDALRERLGTVGDMVDMEGAAVMRVCAAETVPLAMIKCISDTAGDGQRKLLRANLEEMSKKLADLALERLTSRSRMG